MKTKHYGIFSVRIDSHNEDSFEHEKRRLVERLLERPEPLLVKAWKVFEGRRNNVMLDYIRVFSDAEKHERKNMTSRFFTRYFVHETDENGWYKPSMGELLEAQKAIEGRKSQLA